MKDTVESRGQVFDEASAPVDNGTLEPNEPGAVRQVKGTGGRLARAWSWFEKPLSSRVRALGILAIAGLLAWGWEGFADYVRWAGRAIPTGDPLRDYVQGALWAVVLGVLVWFLPLRRGDRMHVLRLWVLKAFVTLAVMLVYEERYTSLDAYGYYLSAQLGLLDGENFGSGSGTQYTIFFAWLVSKVTGQSFHAMKVAFSFVGLWGIYLCYRAATLYVGREDRRLLYLFGLFPTIVFWSSTLGKDPIVLLGVGLYSYGMMVAYRQSRPAGIGYALLGVAMAVALRPWMGLILVVPALAFVRVAYERAGTPQRRAALLAFLLASVAASVALFAYVFNATSVERIVQLGHDLSRSWDVGGSGNTPPEFDRLLDMILFVPAGVYSALFRPMPGEIIDPFWFGLVIGFESFLLLFLLVRAVARTRWRELRDPVLLWATAIVLLWSTLYGFVSFQNLGTAVRFRLMIVPFYLGLVVYLGRVRGRRGSAASVRSSDAEDLRPTSPVGNL